MKLARRGHNDEAQPCRCIERGDNDQAMAQLYNCMAKIYKKRRTVTGEPPWNGQQKQLLRWDGA